jgi:hypothetical protein
VGSDGATGAAAPAVSIPLSGNALTGNAGDVSASSGLFLTLTGVDASTAVATLAAGTALTLTGEEGAATTGDLAYTAGSALTGVALTGAPGAVDALDVAIALAARVAHGFVGTMAGGNDKVIGLTGTESAADAGGFATFLQALLAGSAAVAVASDLMPGIGLTGVVSSSQAGNVAATCAIMLSGVGATGYTGLPYPIRPDTGHGHVFILTYRHEYTAKIPSVQRTIPEALDQRDIVTAVAQGVLVTA